jgi:hypothetical protein
MKSDDDYSDSDTSIDNNSKPVKKVTKIGTNKVIRYGVPSFCSHDDVTFPFVTILDTGTEWSVVGGPAWSIMKQYSQSLNMAAVDADMQSVPMKLCDSVTVVLNNEGQVALFGVRSCGYSPTLTENEAVINNHLLCEAGWTVDCVSRHHGGTQSLSPFDGETWTMEYDPNKYKLYIKCRAPTASELHRLHINWVTCHLDDLAIEQGLKPVRRRQVINMGPMVYQPGISPTAPELINKSDVGDNTPASCFSKDKPSSFFKPSSSEPLNSASDRDKDQEEQLLSEDLNLEEPRDDEQSNPAVMANMTKENKSALPESPDDTIDWQKTLGYMTDVVTAKTIANTTQFYPTCVESENREYPCQHRQKRLHALHY